MKPPTNRSMMQRCQQFGTRIVRAGTLWLEHDGGILSAAVAYYSSLSILPMFLLVFTVVGYFFADGTTTGQVDQYVLEAIEAESSPQLKQAIAASLSQTHRNSAGGNLFSLVWLLAMAVLVFAQIDRGFSRIWGGRSHASSNTIVSAVVGVIMNRLRAIILLTGLGAIMASMFVLSLAVESVEQITRWSIAGSSWPVALLHTMFHLVTNTLFFSLLFKWFSQMEARWSDVLHSACLLALTWEAGRQLMATFIVHNYSDLYGVIGSFLVILLWTYYASMQLFFWASYLMCLSQERKQCESNSPATVAMKSS